MALRSRGFDNKIDDPDVYNIDKIGEGQTGEEALRIAVYCCLKYREGFARTAISAVNHSGDSDSTGAIAGMIVGARFSIEVIDEKWLRGLEFNKTNMEVAQDLFEGCPVNNDGSIDVFDSDPEMNQFSKPEAGEEQR